MTGSSSKRWFKMRLVPYALAIVLMLGFLILRAPPAFAQTFAQGGGLIYGSVYGFTWDDQLVPLVWVQVTTSDPNTRPILMRYSLPQQGGMEYSRCTCQWELTI